jgi:HlyD family secretion protein
MTAYVNIPVATATAVVKLPNAALRFRPPGGPDAIRALFARFGIDDRDAAGDAPRPKAPTTAPSADGGAALAIVWKLHPDNTIEPVQVALGITDHAFTQVVRMIHGDLQDGDQVVTTSINAKAASPGAPAAPGGRR